MPRTRAKTVMISRTSHIFALALSVMMLVFVSCEGKPQATQSHASRHARTQKVSKEPFPVATPSPQILVRTATPSISGPLFLAKPDGIWIPGYDDRPASAPPELKRFDASIFLPPVNVFRERAIITRPDAHTTTFTVPAECHEIGFLMRATAVEDEWPHLTVSLVEAKQPSHQVALFKGTVSNRELRYFWWRIPDEFRGKICRLEVKLHNPRYEYWQIAAVVSHVILR